MKKVTKTLSLVALCAVMIIMSIVPAFAATNQHLEDHSVLDCTNRYKEGTSEFHFTIKVPKGYSTSNVALAVTGDSEGTRVYEGQLGYYRYGTISYLYTDGNSDYYELVTPKLADAGIGIKLYCYYNGVSYMATDTANGSTTEGRGYWLSA